MGGLERARIPFIVQSRPGLAHQTELSWQPPSELVDWAVSGEAVFGWRFSGFHVAQLTARRGRGMFAGWHATASSFTKQRIARGRDEQRCFRRVQNYFGVLREKELFDRPFFFFPQASPAEHLQVNEVDHLRDSMFCVRFWGDVEEQWKEKIGGKRYGEVRNFKKVRKFKFEI